MARASSSSVCAADANDGWKRPSRNGSSKPGRTGSGASVKAALKPAARVAAATRASAAPKRIGDRLQRRAGELGDPLAAVAQGGRERVVAEQVERLVVAGVEADLHPRRHERADPVGPQPGLRRRAARALDERGREGVALAALEAPDRVGDPVAPAAAARVGDRRQQRVGGVEAAVERRLQRLPEEGARAVQRGAAEVERRRGAERAQRRRRVGDVHREVVVEGDREREALAAPARRRGREHVARPHQPVAGGERLHLGGEQPRAERRDEVVARAPRRVADAVVAEHEADEGGPAPGHAVQRGGDGAARAAARGGERRGGRHGPPGCQLTAGRCFTALCATRRHLPSTTSAAREGGAGRAEGCRLARRRTNLVAEAHGDLLQTA